MTKKITDERVIELKRDFALRCDMRKHSERTWLLNTNFYKGNQYAEILPTGAIALKSKKYGWEQQDVYNHIAPIIESRISKFNKIKADVSCLPMSEDMDDVQSAKLSTKLLNAAKEQVGFRKRMQEAIYWAELTGTAFYKIGWNKTKGMRLSKEPSIYEGDIEVCVCPPYEIYPDSLSAGDVGECQSIIHAKIYPLERAEAIWGVELEPEKVSMLSSMGTSVVDAECWEAGNYVLVLERYSLPDKEYPDGRLLIVAGDKVLYDGVLPYVNETDGRRGFPFVRQTALSVPASFFGTSVIERLVPLQRAYNEIKNRKHEYFDRMVSGVMLAEDGSVDTLDLEEDGVSPGKVLIYRQGCEKPEIMDFGSVPPEFGEEEDKLIKEFVSISGATDLFMNNSVNLNNLSGTALNLLMEQDNNRLCSTTESIRNAVKAVSEKILRMYKQFSGTQRLMKVAGKEGKVMVAYFAGNDISADNIAFDLDEEQTATLTAKREAAKEIFNMGLLRNENGDIAFSDRRKLLKLLGYGNMENDPTLDELQRSRAMKENEESINKAPEVDILDDHNIHIEEHTKYALGNEGDKERNERLRKHIAEHKACLREQNEQYLR